MQNIHLVTSGRLYRLHLTACPAEGMCAGGGLARAGVPALLHGQQPRPPFRGRPGQAAERGRGQPMARGATQTPLSSFCMENR